ncbi:peptidase P60 [Rhodopseudomonas palustris]|uniref:Peptidase P60 n=1 Tax=Rhodopseudomonas palustris TaxID=1076 RepID=A0A418V4D6_RHOPL|nr:peptidase P60 [Rhodopseudomonas palustris]
MAGAAIRDRIVAEARGWIGTPYVHQASCKGSGADCLGLVRGVWRALYGHEPEIPPAYGQSWAEESGEETLRDAARRHLIEIDVAAAMPGDVILIRVRDRGPAKHAAILVEPGRIVHAYDRHAVQECALPDAWRRRTAYAFRFPYAE